MTLYDILDNIPTDGKIVIKIWSWKQSKYVVTRPYNELDAISRENYHGREVLYMYAEEIDYEPCLVFELESIEGD